MMYIKDMPPEDRPRERIATTGAHALCDHELVSAVLGSGIKGKRIDLLADEVLGILDRAGRGLGYEDLRGHLFVMIETSAGMCQWEMRFREDPSLRYTVIDAISPQRSRCTTELMGGQAENR